MDPRLVEIVENLDTYKIGLDDQFAFKCRGCGKCCKHREDIMLTPRDLYRIACKLGMSMDDVAAQYCDKYVGQTSRIPIVRLKPKGITECCPFLEGKRCAIHEAKPVVCAMYPVGRILMADDADEGLITDKTLKAGYILNPSDTANCNAGHKTQTVRGWLEKWNIPVEDEFYILWNEMLIYLTSHISRAEEKYSSQDTLMDALWKLIYVMLYLDYSIDEDFFMQFKTNMAVLRKRLDAFEKFLPDTEEPGGNDEKAR